MKLIGCLLAVGIAQAGALSVSAKPTGLSNRRGRDDRLPEQPVGESWAVSRADGASVRPETTVHQKATLYFLSTFVCLFMIFMTAIGDGRFV